MAAELRPVSPGTLGMTPSRHTVKMLLWMAATDSLLVLSGHDTHEQQRRSSNCTSSGVELPGAKLARVNGVLTVALQFEILVMPQEKSQQEHTHTCVSSFFLITYLYVFKQI